MRLMSVTRDTSHAAIGPWGPSKQLPCGDSLRHASTALLSCTLDSGENAGVKFGVGQSSSCKSKFVRDNQRICDSVRVRFMWVRWK